jgi:hypothetical protein
MMETRGARTMKMKTTRWTDTVRIGQRNTISLDAVPVGTTLMTTSDQVNRSWTGTTTDVNIRKPPLVWKRIKEASRAQTSRSDAQA